MITIKIKVKEEAENHIDVKVEVPKDVSKSTQFEKDVSKHIVESLNSIFDKKEEE